jgi:hypothetical protein
MSEGMRNQQCDDGATTPSKFPALPSFFIIAAPS